MEGKQRRQRESDVLTVGQRDFVTGNDCDISGSLSLSLSLPLLPLYGDRWRAATALSSQRLYKAARRSRCPRCVRRVGAGRAGTRAVLVGAKGRNFCW